MVCDYCGKPIAQPGMHEDCAQIWHQEQKAGEWFMEPGLEQPAAVLEYWRDPPAVPLTRPDQ